jgi:hypothetical protein
MTSFRAESCSEKGATDQYGFEGTVDANGVPAGVGTLIVSVAAKKLSGDQACLKLGSVFGSDIAEVKRQPGKHLEKSSSRECRHLGSPKQLVVNQP